MTKAQDELARLKDEQSALGPSVRRAAEARAVMDNEMVIEAFAEIEKKLTSAIMGSTIDQRGGGEYAKEGAATSCHAGPPNEEHRNREVTSGFSLVHTKG